MLNHTSENNEVNAAFTDFTDEYEEKKDLISHFDAEDDEDYDDDDEFETISDFVEDTKDEPLQTGIKKTLINFQEHFESFVSKFKETKEDETLDDEYEDEEYEDEDEEVNSLVRDIKNLQKTGSKSESTTKKKRKKLKADDDEFVDLNKHHKQINKANEEAKQIIDKANEEAQKIMDEANLKANQLIAVTQKRAYDEGFEQGYDDSITKYSVTFQNNMEEYLAKIEADINAMNKQKDLILTEQMAEMRDLSIAIAEKIINISLKSSGNIIEKMIETATERIKSVAWAKLHVSQLDWELSIKSDAQILNTLKKVTDTVKIEILDNDEVGTCIIELPDRIIDASVKTQLEKIRTVLESAN